MASFSSSVQSVGVSSLEELLILLEDSEEEIEEEEREEERAPVWQEAKRRREGISIKNLFLILFNDSEFSL